MFKLLQRMSEMNYSLSRSISNTDFKAEKTQERGQFYVSIGCAEIDLECHLQLPSLSDTNFDGLELSDRLICEGRIRWENACLLPYVSKQAIKHTGLH